MFVNPITPSYNTSFGSKVSLSLKQKLWTESFMLGEKYLNRMNSKIDRIERNGRNDTVIDTIKSSSGDLQHIIVRNPKISHKVMVAISSNADLYDAFMRVKENSIKLAEKRLVDLACAYDN